MFNFKPKMSEAQEENAAVLFEIRNDKDRGTLILTVRKNGDDTVFFFKYHHQPINQHPEIMQRIVGESKPTTRTKTIKVNIMDFLRQYWNGTSFEFKGVVMNSTAAEKSKVFNRLLNKEIGAKKRKQTIEESKQKKLEEKNAKVRSKWTQDEAEFQAERAMRIAELFENRDDHSEQQKVE